MPKTKAKESLSMNNKRELLQAAISKQFGRADSYTHVTDFTDTDVVYSASGVDYSVPYTIEEDESVKLGDPVKVVSQTVYKKIEAARKAYSALVLEAGRRDVGSLGDEIQSIAEKLDAMTGAAEDEKEADSLIGEINRLTDQVKALEVSKTEDGLEYPASAFAYVPDSTKPSTWKLRLWEDPTKKITRTQLGRAAAALSPGGFRGNRVEIPADDLPAVKRKIRAAYTKLSVEPDDIPKWVKENEVRTWINDFIPLTEAKITSSGKGEVVVIKPGFNTSKKRYYPPETLARDYGIFEGAKMYADHPSESEERDRPERSIKDWVAVLEKVHVRNSDGAVVGSYNVIEPWMEAKLAKLRDAGQLGKMGVSIDAIGGATRQKIEGVQTDFVEKLIRARSVDFVTEPGAGGSVELFEASDHSLDVDLIDVEVFKERRPDIVELIEADVKSEYIKEAKKQMELEQQVKDLTGQVDTLTTENTELKGRIAEADKAKARAEAQAEIKTAIEKAELPEPTKARLTEQFKEADTSDGIQEAITAEVDYLSALTESGKIKGLGNTNPEKVDKEQAKKALAESFKGLGMTDEQAERAARG